MDGVGTTRFVQEAEADQAGLSRRGDGIERFAEGRILLGLLWVSMMRHWRRPGEDGSARTGKVKEDGSRSPDHGPDPDMARGMPDL